MNAELEHYFRIRRQGQTTILEVNTVSWLGPHTPIDHWQPFRKWTTPPTPTQIAEAQQAALTDPNFFARCRYCHEICPIGQMHNDDVCHGCAETHEGIIH